MSDPLNVPSREWVIKPETEYRFELDSKDSLAIQLVKGQAEIFGAELAEGKSYVFGSECKAAIFTWQGCTIEMSDLFLAVEQSSDYNLSDIHVTGRPSTEYVSDETPMTAYANVHLALEQMRVRALRAIHGSPASEDQEGEQQQQQNRPLSSDDTKPPRVLVLGPENSGKTSVCKILTNYAVRTGQDWSPMLVNTDPSEGGWSVPGAVSAVAVHAPIHTSSPVNPLGSTATSAPAALSSSALVPIVYWYGHAGTKRNPLLLNRIIRNLGENVHDRLDMDATGRASGIIVDTPSSFASGQAAGSDHRNALIKACVDAFRINVILVVGHEKLNVEMQRLYEHRLTVVKIPKSGGVVELDHTYRERVHNYQLYAYMYGQVIKPPRGVSSPTLAGESMSELALAPSSSIIDFSDLTIYRIGAESMAPSSALPIGATRVVSEMQPVQIDPSQNGSRLLNAVLALLSPPNSDENERYDEEILDLTVTGFLVVTNLDIPNRKMTILAPNQGLYTGKTAIVGSFEWQDQ